MDPELVTENTYLESTQSSLGTQNASPVQDIWEGMSMSNEFLIF